MDIARDICTDSFYIVNSGLPCIAVTAVVTGFNWQVLCDLIWNICSTIIILSLNDNERIHIMRFKENYDDTG